MVISLGLFRLTQRPNLFDQRDKSASRRKTVAFYRHITGADAKASRPRFVASAQQKVSALIGEDYNVYPINVDQ
jgi:hypothetical protein